MSKQEDQQETALAFVTRKVLLTLNPPVCLLMSGTPVFAGAVIAEYQQDVGDQRMCMPQEFNVVGTPDGRKLSKTYRVRIGGYHGVAAMVELDDSDFS